MIEESDNSVWYRAPRSPEEWSDTIHSIDIGGGDARETLKDFFEGDQ
jgi:hypothetical protein